MCCFKPLMCSLSCCMELALRLRNTKSCLCLSLCQVMNTACTANLFRINLFRVNLFGATFRVNLCRADLPAYQDNVQTVIHHVCTIPPYSLQSLQDVISRFRCTTLGQHLECVCNWCRCSQFQFPKCDCQLCQKFLVGQSQGRLENLASHPPCDIHLHSLRGKVNFASWFFLASPALISNPCQCLLEITYAMICWEDKYGRWAFM